MKIKKYAILAIIIICCLVINFIYHKIEIKTFIVKLAGYSILVVDSGSMFPQIPVGTCILIKESKEYKEGDIITYCENNNYLVTHRIIEKQKEGYITKGDYNNIKDENMVTEEQIEGKVILYSNILGKIIRHKEKIIILFVTIDIICIIIKKVKYEK